MRLIPTAAISVIIAEKWAIKFHGVTLALKICAVVSIIEMRVISFGPPSSGAMKMRM